ncbi:MAG: hypothetical protein IIZ48_07685 [Erysipelotrichales bacterium]|nr:hypothetical protein [Erysipelotrichales bacterium]
MNPKEIRTELRGSSWKTNSRKQIQNYLTEEYHQCIEMTRMELEARLVSAANWAGRHQYDSCRDFGLNIQPGDICFLDYGRGYLKEAGYQHFGLVVSLCEGKAFVVPMTSNEKTYARAFDPKKNPEGLKNLYALGDVEGLNKRSVLFLNDGKYINTARIIQITGHISTGGTIYREIIERLRECLKI